MIQRSGIHGEVGAGTLRNVRITQVNKKVTQHADPTRVITALATDSQCNDGILILTRSLNIYCTPPCTAFKLAFVRDGLVLLPAFLRAHVHLLISYYIIVNPMVYDASLVTSCVYRPQYQQTTFSTAVDLVANMMYPTRNVSSVYRHCCRNRSHSFGTR